MERTGLDQWKPREVARLLALVETERRYYQEIVAALPIALAVLTADRSFVLANRAFRRALDVPTEDLRNKTIEQIIPSSELIEGIRSARIQRGAEPLLVSLRDRLLRIAIVPLRGLEEDKEEILLAVEDLSGLESRQHVPSVVLEPAALAPAALAPAIIWQADASTLAFDYVGGAVGAIPGLSGSSWPASAGSFYDRIHRDDRPDVEELYKDALASGGTVTAEFRSGANSGEPVWCRETIQVSPPNGSAKRSVWGVLTSIAQRQELESQTRVAERLDALRELAARLAHDFHNPLMVVTGHAEEILRSLPSVHPLRTDLREILAAAGQLTDLTNQLLNFTRTQAQTAPQTAQPVALAPVFAGIQRRLRELHSVEISCVSPRLEVLADPGLLAEAILALTSFAIEKTSQVSTLSVTSGLSRITECLPRAPLRPGVYVRIEIHAAGHGTAASVYTAFESFLSESGSAAARAYANIRQWGGDAAFSSDPEQGSTFVIYLRGAHQE